MYLSIIELHRETHTVPPTPVGNPNSISKPTPHSPAELFDRITPTCNLFFTYYISEDSIRPRWFLVRIELELSYSLDLQPESTSNYLVAFLARHPADTQKTDDQARWWPEWHEFTIGADNILDFGQRILFHPCVNQVRLSSVFEPISFHSLIQTVTFRDHCSLRLVSMFSIHVTTWHAITDFSFFHHVPCPESFHQFCLHPVPTIIHHPPILDRQSEQQRKVAHARPNKNLYLNQGRRH